MIKRFVLLHKDHLFPNCTRSIHQPISCTFEFTNSQSTLVISIGVAWTYFIANETNLFKLFSVPSAWITSDCTKMHLMEATSGLLHLLCQTYRLHYPSSVYWLMSVFQKLDDNFRCNVAYKRFFLYHRLAHGPAYTRTTDDWFVEPRDTDDWLVEPHCFMFLQGLLALFIHHLSNLMHHSHLYLCCKLNIFPPFDSQIKTVFKLLHKYLVTDLNE